jgi:polyisoprenyl-teichoic acid--peptidoglycan teichoic acid transferase
MFRTTTSFAMCLCIGILLASCGGNPPPALASPAQGADASDGLGASPAPNATASSSPIASPSPSATAPATPPFTILVLGADSHGRTDAIMVVGIDPTAKRVTYASIPRDTVNSPLPDGAVFTNRKINEFYNLAARSGADHPEGAGRATADAVGALLKIQIDYYAQTNFAGFTSLIDSVGGVPITLPQAVSDDFLQVGPSTFGITFPKGKQTLDGRKALVFARIRHADTDFARQRRQQSLVTAAGQLILNRPDLAPALVAAAMVYVHTDFPLERAAAYQASMAGFDARNVEGVVLGPRSYETRVECPCGYALAPKLAEMRAKAASLFPWAVQD